MPDLPAVPDFDAAQAIADALRDNHHRVCVILRSGPRAGEAVDGLGEAPVASSRALAGAFAGCHPGR
jgi:hypothetical protein